MPRTRCSVRNRPPQPGTRRRVERGADAKRSEFRGAVPQWRAGRAGGRGAREEGAALRRVNGAKVNPAALKGAGLLLPGAGAAGRLQGDAGRSAIAGRLGRRAGGRAMPSLRRPAPRVQALRTEGCFAFSGPPPLPGVSGGTHFGLPRAPRKQSFSPGRESGAFSAPFLLGRARVRSLQ